MLNSLFFQFLPFNFEQNGVGEKFKIQVTSNEIVKGKQIQLRATKMCGIEARQHTFLLLISLSIRMNGWNALRHTTFHILICA